MDCMLPDWEVNSAIDVKHNEWNHSFWRSLSDELENTLHSEEKKVLQGL